MCGIGKEVSRRIKLVTLDLDGTVVGKEGAVSERTRIVVGRLQEAGVSVALATGRPWFGAKEIASTLDISSPSLFYSGALLLNPATSEVYQECFIEPKAVKEVLIRATQLGIYTELYTRGGYYSAYDCEARSIHAQYLGGASEISSLLEVSFCAPLSARGCCVKDGGPIMPSSGTI